MNYATLADGCIVPSKDAPFGYSDELYDGWLWKSGDRVFISMIVCKNQGRGDFSRLLAAIEVEGFKVAVPTPSGPMRAILERKGFKPTWEDTEIGPCEVMVRP